MFITTKTAGAFPHRIFAHGQIKYTDRNFLVIGGQSDGGKLLDTIYSYDNRNNNWILITDANEVGPNRDVSLCNMGGCGDIPLMF